MDGTKVVVELLRERDCDLVQGYWMGRPLDAAGVVALLTPPLSAAAR